MFLKLIKTLCCRNDDRIQKVILLRKSIFIHTNVFRLRREALTIRRDEILSGAIQNFNKTINIMALHHA